MSRFDKNDYNPNIKRVSNTSNTEDIPVKYNFDYIPMDFSLYDDINNLPLRYDSFLNVSLKMFPEFMRDIINDTCVSIDGKRSFMQRFGIYYSTDPKFRERTKNYTFLFFNGEYIGAYKSEPEAFEEGKGEGE